MPLVYKNQDGKGSVAIEGSMTIYESVELHTKLLECLNESQEIELTLKNVTACDLTGLQLMWAARHLSQDMRKPFVVTDISDQIIGTAQQLGIDPQEFLGFNQEV